MSHLPSPLKSPVPTTDQPELAPTAPTVPSCGVERPFISQIATVPVGLWNQRMSLRPSMLKSWAAVTELPMLAVHTPRPWVAAASAPWFKTRSSTGTLGSPELNGLQVVPPSCVRYTPRSVPTRISVVGAVGSSTMALTGMLGRRLGIVPLMSVHLPPLLVDIHTWPSSTPGVPKPIQLEREMAGAAERGRAAAHAGGGPSRFR